MLSKHTILAIHTLVTLLLVYLSYSIINNKPIPKNVGYALGVLALVVVSVHIIAIFHKGHDSNSHPKPNDMHTYGPTDPEHSMNIGGNDTMIIDPNDPEYNQIGGAGGVGWL